MAMFRSRFVGEFAILTLLFTTAESQASNKPSDAELAAITARGVLLAEYDTAAWQATDAVQAAHSAEGLVGRYIGRKTRAGWVVDFGRVNQAQDEFLVAYEAVQASSKFEVKNFDPGREDTGWNLGAAKGIETAMHDFGATSRPYNIAVLLADHESFYVYLYPAQVTAGIYPLGADVRYHVSPDGTKIIETSFGPSRPRSSVKSNTLYGFASSPTYTHRRAGRVFPALCIGNVVSSVATTCDCRTRPAMRS